MALETFRASALCLVTGALWGHTLLSFLCPGGGTSHSNILGREIGPRKGQKRRVLSCGNY